MSSVWSLAAVKNLGKPLALGKVLLGTLVLGMLVGMPAEAHAQPAVPTATQASMVDPMTGNPRYYLLSVEGDRIFVDMGKKDGVMERQVLQIFKTNVSFDHPVNGQKVVGTTYLADVTVIEVGDSFSIAQAPATVLAQLKPGYEVRFRPQDMEQVRSARAQLRDMMAALQVDKETWEQKARREMVRFNNNNNTISATGEYVQFGKEDYYARTQADFNYRLFRRLYALRFGVGSMTGYGPNPRYSEGGVEDPSEYVAYYFGYTQAELRLAPYFSMMPTLQLGLNNDGIGMGFGTDIRIGPELGTNIVLTGGTAARVGTQLGLKYNHFITDRLALSGKAMWENYVTGNSNAPSVRVLLGGQFDLSPALRVVVEGGIGGRDVTAMGPSVSVGLAWNFATGLWWMQELE